MYELSVYRSHEQNDPYPSWRYQIKVTIAPGDPLIIDSPLNYYNWREGWHEAISLFIKLLPSRAALLSAETEKQRAWKSNFGQVGEDLQVALKNLNLGKQLAEKLGLPESHKPIYEALCKALEITQEANNIYDESK